MGDTRYLLTLTRQGDRFSAFSRSLGDGPICTRVRDAIGPLMAGQRVRLHTDTHGMDRLIRAFDAELRGRDADG